MGVRLGQSRIAVRSPDCVRCGLCLTGCPYSLVYSSADTFDELRRRGRINYQANLLVVNLEEREGRPTVTATDMRTAEPHQFKADRVYVACGAIGTTRLVLGSLRRYGEDVELQESAQFIVPFVSLRRTSDPRREAEHALAQLFMLLKLPPANTESAHVSLYTYSSAFNDALPSWARPFAGSVFRRLSAGLGFLPSSLSPRLRVRLMGPGAPGQLPRMAVSPAGDRRRRSAVLGQITRQLLLAAPRLDLWPVLPRMALAPLGKSYHWGSSFPHSEGNGSSLATDRFGRLPTWERIHLVDASVLPSIAATTFTLTAMANAHRIAEESLTLDGST
jgi:ferredoxin